MKKHLVLAAAVVFGALALPAQENVLKEAKRAKTPEDVVRIITPAFTNPETAQLAETYVIPGKAMFEAFDDLFVKAQLGQLPEGGSVQMADYLMEGYGYYMKALPLDSLPNAKGKIKPKYSKDIINTIAGHFDDFNRAGMSYNEAKNYKSSCEAFGVVVSLAENPLFAKVINNLPNDTVIGQVSFYQAITAKESDQLERALVALGKAKAHGYKDKQLYDYAIYVASIMEGKEDVMFEYASEALPLYGKEDSNYFGVIINYYLQKEDYVKAESIIDEAIANDPINAQYYLIKGILYDNQSKLAESKAMFAIAIELDAYNWQALYNYGRALCNEAYALSDAAPTDPEESDKYYKEKLVPLFKQAAEYLEQSWNINNENKDALNYLENVYYNLKDEKNLKDVEARKAL